MASLINSVIEGYDKFFEERGDPRTADWPLMNRPGPLVLLLIAYVVFCTRIGPYIMRDRKPMKLNTALFIYNAAQVLGSAWLVYEGLDAAWLHYDLQCQPIDYSNSPQAIRVAKAVWWYFAFKVIELLDTVFFVLRKKSNQVTFLHLYHHTLMPLCGYIGTRFLAGGHGTLMGVINSGVHVIMYFYYLVAAMGPQYQKYLWWKSYLTLMQMIQFCIVFLHMFQTYFNGCNYPKFITTLMCLNAIIFLYMFGSFYVRNFILKPKSTAAKEKQEKEKQEKEKQEKEKQEKEKQDTEKQANGNGHLSLNNNVHKEKIN